MRDPGGGESWDEEGDYAFGLHTREGNTQTHIEEYTQNNTHINTQDHAQEENTHRGTDAYLLRLPCGHLPVPEGLARNISKKTFMGFLKFPNDHKTNLVA